MQLAKKEQLEAKGWKVDSAEEFLSPVPKLAMGCAALGTDYSGTYIGVERSLELLKYAVEQGITVFDTSPRYGLSQAILHKFFRSTKGITVLSKVQDMTDLRLMDRSSWGRRWVGIFQLTLPSDDLLAAVFSYLPEYGCVGFSVYPEHAEQVLSMEPDWIQLPYSILDRRSANWLHEAHALGIKTVARSVLLRGALTGKGLEPKPPADIAKQMTKWFDEDTSVWAQMALRFVYFKDFIDYALVGFTSEREIDEALEAIKQGPLDQVYSVTEFDESVIDPRRW